MTTADFVAELMRQFDWRFDELRKLKNLVTSETSPSGRDDLRRPLVVFLYAHLEGFCVFALQHYLSAVNRERLSCRNAVPAIIAGAWETLFNAMAHGDEKCEVFRKTLPNDPRLHRHWRRRHFVEEIDRFWGFRVVIPEEVIDSESNLKPAVLQRNLFLLGLDHTFVNLHADAIHNLLKRRNGIAHGEDRRGVPEVDYEKYESAVFEICYKLIDFLEDAHANERFSKPDPGYCV